MIKKILVALGILLGLFVVAAMAVPLFVDVDKYRPQIIQAADQQLNGKLELGKLSLSLWGQVKIQIDGMQLSDSQGRKIVSVKDAYFHLPFTSILAGSPSLILSLKEPAINVVKDKSGKLNVMTLVKQTPVTGKPSTNIPTTGAVTSPQAPSEIQLPGIVTHSRLGVEIRHALLTYRDEVAGLDSQIRDLNVIIKNLSLSHQMSLDIFADIDTEAKAGGSQGAMSARGPVHLTATANPHVSGGKFESVEVQAKMSLDDLEITIPGVFHKAKGVDAHADLALKASPDMAQIDQVEIKFFNADLQGKGSLAHLMSSAPAVDFSLKSNVIELKSWSQLVPMLTQYELGGSAELSAEAHGPAAQLGYKALFKINGLTAKAPNLKGQPRFDALISVITDQVDQLSLTMKAPGNDLSIRGKIAHFQAPHVDFDITSTGMDLDQLVDFPPPAKTEKPIASAPAEGPGTPAAKKADFDAMLEPLRANKVMQGLVANVNLNLRQIKAKGVAIQDLAGRISMRDLVANIDSFGMKVFGGTIKANLSTNLRPKAPTYKFGAAVSGVDLAQAVASQVQTLKNTLIGKASFDMSGSGASFNPDPAITSLSAKGKFKVDHATFTTLDVSKMVSDGLSGALGKIGDKIPGLKGKKVGGLPEGGSKYDFISANFTINNGKFVMPDFVAKASPNQGIDLKGDVAAGLKDYSLKANFQVIDTYNMTGARDLSVDQAGVVINHVLADGNSPVQFPVSAGCTMMAPCYSYIQTTEYLLKIAIKNASGALKSKAQDMLKQAAPSIQNQLQGLGKKLFGH